MAVTLEPQWHMWLCVAHLTVRAVQVITSRWAHGWGMQRGRWWPPLSSPWHNFGLRIDNWDNLWRVPKQACFSSHLVSVSFGDRRPWQLFVENFNLAWLDSERRMSVENPGRDFGPESLNTFRCSSIPNWVWPLRVWVLLQLCSSLQGRGLRTLVTKLSTDSDLWGGFQMLSCSWKK